MRVVAIVQARMGSARLPGKSLADVEGRSMLARVCERLRGSRLATDLIVATSSAADDRQIVEECRRLAIPSFCGSQDDVLDRYYHAARWRKADLVVRVTADCPLIDPELVDDVIEAAVLYEPDYASNVQRRTYPRGLDTEVVTIGALERAWREARQPYQRAHVMPYLYQPPSQFKLHSVTGQEDFSHLRWTVDTADDLRLVRKIYAALGGPGQFSWRAVLALFEESPELGEINGHVRQKQLVEG